MPPPVQLLCAPRAFVGTLTLPPDSLARHLSLLKGCVSSLEVAQEVARCHTGALLAPSAEALLGNAQSVGQLLGLAQVGQQVLDVWQTVKGLSSQQHQSAAAVGAASFSEGCVLLCCTAAGQQLPY
jgi:hypothetical protein